MLATLLPALLQAEPVQGAPDRTITVCEVGCDYQTIQAASSWAEAGDTISIAAGRYVENIELRRSLTLEGEGEGATIVDGGGDGSTFTIMPDATIHMSRMTITGGSGTPRTIDGLRGRWGGGIYHAGESLTLESVTVSGNVVRPYDDEQDPTPTAAASSRRAVGTRASFRARSPTTPRDRRRRGNVDIRRPASCSNLPSPAIPRSSTGAVLWLARGPWSTAARSPATPPPGTVVGIANWGAELSDGEHHDLRQRGRRLGRRDRAQLRVDRGLAELHRLREHGSVGGQIQRRPTAGPLASVARLSPATPAETAVAPVRSDGHNIEGGDELRFDGPGDIGGIDPLLGALAGNGGLTHTHLHGPPCRGRGSSRGLSELWRRGARRRSAGIAAAGRWRRRWRGAMRRRVHRARAGADSDPDGDPDLDRYGHEHRDADGGRKRQRVTDANRHAGPEPGQDHGMDANGLEHGGTMRSLNPATGETIADYEELSRVDLAERLGLASEAFAKWRRSPFDQQRLRRAADVSGPRAKLQLMADEMGKPIGEGRAEAEKCAWVCEYYAEHAASFLGRRARSRPTPASSFVTVPAAGRRAGGHALELPVLAGVSLRRAGADGGQRGLLKHATNVPGCALAIEEVFREAGFPGGPLHDRCSIGGGRVWRRRSSTRASRAVTLTGSTAGRAARWRRAAGERSRRPCSSSAAATPTSSSRTPTSSAAVGACVDGRLINAGQSCIAAKRFIVVEPIRDEFETRFVDADGRDAMGDPLDASDRPRAPWRAHDLRDELHHQVAREHRSGAPRCLLGGEIPDGPGAFYPPTVLTDVRPGHAGLRRGALRPGGRHHPGARTRTRRIRVANDTRLRARRRRLHRAMSARGERIAAVELEAGCCFVNAFVESDPRLPFGGIKESGYGRELSVTTASASS